MAVHGIWISPERKRASAADRALRECFTDVCRVSPEFWLVDTARDADSVAATISPALCAGDRLFVAALTRDTHVTLSSRARAWLSEPCRSWRSVGSGLGTAPAKACPLAAAA